MSRLPIPMIMCRAHLRIHRLLSPSFSHRPSSTSGPPSQKPSSTRSPIERIRNVGIIAHIDAGKTTTTERFLYYSGLTGNMGEVHDGDTVTDFMEQERDRGITITSASVTLPWQGHRVNLIDTPGHVDFTVEVERSLSVLDSAIIVLDASEGVEAQTVTVCHQADRHHIPRIAYLNKMDKVTADVDLCLKTIHQLGSRTLLTQLPVKTNGTDFDGILDLVSMQRITWDRNDEVNDSGEVFVREDVTKGDHMYDECLSHRESLIAAIADADESMAEQVLAADDVLSIPAAAIRTSLRNVTISRSFVPVLLGSSFKKVAVQPLLDAIVTLLPSPRDVIKRNTSYFSDTFCGLAFKVMHHKVLGTLTFIRVYSGEVRTNSRIFNVNRMRAENISKVFIALADQFKEVPYISDGNIVAVTGLECITGDTLVASAAALEEVKRRYSIDAGRDRWPSENPHSLSNASGKATSGTDASSKGASEQGQRISGSLVSSESDDEDDGDIPPLMQTDACIDPPVQTLLPLLAGPLVPDPVFFCSVEAPSPSKEKALEKGLRNLQREDPSLKVRVEDSGQVTLSGMGQLHLEIIKDRLLKEYDVEAFMGPLQVAYRESIDQEIREVANTSKIIGGVRNSCNLVIVLKPSDSLLDQRVTKSPLKVVVNRDNGLGKLRKDHRKAITNGIVSAFTCGPMLNFPVLGVRVELHEFEASNSTSAAFIASVTSTTVTTALRKANISLLEPVMRLEITVPVKFSTKIIGDLSSRRSLLGEVSERNNVRYIESMTPLADLVNYSSALRTLSSGTATLSMLFATYKRMTESEKRIAKQKVTGFA